jgi:hypothetical protein
MNPTEFVSTVIALVARHVPERGVGFLALGVVLAVLLMCTLWLGVFQ